MATILGKVTASASFEIPRGADVSLRIAIPGAWLAMGRTVEVELPRNLSCARCSGGGCSACKNSGAITLRGRTELPEVVQVVLPIQRSTATLDDSPNEAPETPDVADRDLPSSQSNRARGLVIRIPECGGLPDATTGALVRGMLLLEVGVEETASANVRLCEDDEDPLSSAKMLRGETRSSHAPAQSRESVQPVLASRSIRARTSIVDDGGDPPSSRVAPAGSTNPPTVQHSHWVARRGKLPRDGGEPSDLPAPVRRPKRRSAPIAIYVSTVVVAAIGLLALIFL